MREELKIWKHKNEERNYNYYGGDYYYYYYLLRSMSQHIAVFASFRFIVDVHLIIDVLSYLIDLCRK